MTSFRVVTRELSRFSGFLKESETFYTNVRMRAGISSASRKFCIPWSHASGITSGLVDFSIPASVCCACAGQEVVNVGQVARIPMLRMKVLLLLAVTSVLFAGCGGVGEAETSNGAGTTPSVDTTPPSMPTGLTAAVVGSTGANLSWSASSDNVGVVGYVVRRNGVQVATPATTSYADTGLSAATIYSYAVAARDAAGNLSPNSASVSVTTLPPSPSTRAGLAWDAVAAPSP